MGIHPPRLPDPTAPEADRVGHSRRGFLARVAVGGAALAVGSQVVPVGGLLPLGAQEGDDEVAELSEAAVQIQLLASLALGAAAVHRAAAEVTGVPEPSVEVIRSFGAQHGSQGAALNALLPAEAVAVANETLVTEGSAAVQGGAAPAVLAALRDQAEQLAATHLAALEVIEDQNDAQVVVRTFATISQQAVVLGSLAGEPTEAVVIETQTTDGALTAASHPVTTEAEDEAAAEAEGTEAGGSDGESTTTSATEGGADTTTTTEG